MQQSLSRIKMSILFVDLCGYSLCYEINATVRLNNSLNRNQIDMVKRDSYECSQNNKFITLLVENFSTHSTLHFIPQSSIS